MHHLGRDAAALAALPPFPALFDQRIDSGRAEISVRWLAAEQGPRRPGPAGSYKALREEPRQLSILPAFEITCRGLEPCNGTPAVHDEYRRAVLEAIDQGTQIFLGLGYRCLLHGTNPMRAIRASGVTASASGDIKVVRHPCRSKALNAPHLKRGMTSLHRSSSARITCGCGIRLPGLSSARMPSRPSSSRTSCNRSITRSGVPTIMRSRSTSS